MLKATTRSEVRKAPSASLEELQELATLSYAVAEAQTGREARVTKWAALTDDVTD